MLSPPCQHSLLIEHSHIVKGRSRPETCGDTVKLVVIILITVEMLLKLIRENLDNQGRVGSKHLSAKPSKCLYKQTQENKTFLKGFLSCFIRWITFLVISVLVSDSVIKTLDNPNFGAMVGWGGQFTIQSCFVITAWHIH